MTPETPLLDHPFYQAWEAGTVTEDQLANYAAAYQPFMDRVPVYWQRVLDGLDADAPAGRTIVAEERAHADLWTAWRQHLPSADDPPELSSLLDGLEGMGAAELAGALHAYEVQQPAVAATKRAGLRQHYGDAAADLRFFDEHVEGEAEHIAFGRALRGDHADTEAFDRGFERGAALVYHSLDVFVHS